MTYKVAVLPGDGIGSEIMEQAVRVLKELNLETIDNFICTLELLKQNSNYKGKNKKLETACEYYNIENKNAHRADSDTLATAKLFLIIKDEI